MRILAAALALGLLVMAAWLAFQTGQGRTAPKPLAGIAILRLLQGQISAPDYCLRRGLPENADDSNHKARAAMAKLAADYNSMAPAVRQVLQQQFQSVPPEQARSFAQVQTFMQALQQNPSLVTEPSFQPQLALIAEFLQQQCVQLVRGQ